MAAVLLGALLAAPAALPAQDQVKDQAAHEYVVRAITLAITVQDSKGRFVNNLYERDFTVYENNVKKPLTYFSHDFGAPLSLTVLLDVSGSMALLNRLDECKAALRLLATRLLRPRDEIALLIFADGQVQVAARHSTDKTEFLRVLDSTEPYGQTALNDAVAVSPEFATERAVVLDPVGVIVTACLGWHCLFSRQYDEGIEPLLRALRLDSTVFWSYLILGWIYEQKGMLEQAMAEYQQAVSLSGGMVISVAALGHLYGLMGQRGRAEQVLSDLVERAKKSYVSAYDIATIYTGMGDKERAFEWLDKAYDEHSSFLIHIPWDPRFDPLRSDPRFSALLARVGLPDILPGAHKG